MALSIFRRYYRSGKWAARVLKVTPSMVSQWLHGSAKNARLDIEMPLLAEELVRTEGRCCTEHVNGKSVRSKIGRIRRKRSK